MKMTPLKTIVLGFLGGALAIVLWLAIDPAGLVQRPSPAGGQTTGDFERRVRDYLVANPEVLIESIERLQEQRAGKQVDEIAQIIAARSDEIFSDPETPVGGNPEGDVSLVEFFDYNCPYCRRVAPVLDDIERGDDRLRVVYKEWPILGPNSEFAARAALAVRKSEKYVAFHKAMMVASGTMNEGSVLEIAAAVGLDVQRLKEDMKAPEIAALIERNRELARALRITGTPSFVIGREILRGAADGDVIRGLIAQAREK